MIHDTGRNFDLIWSLLSETVVLMGLPNPIEIGMDQKKGTIFFFNLYVEKWPLQTHIRNLINRKRNVGIICGFHTSIAQLKYFFFSIHIPIPKTYGNGDRLKRPETRTFPGWNSMIFHYFKDQNKPKTNFQLHDSKEVAELRIIHFSVFY